MSSVVGRVLAVLALAAAAFAAATAPAQADGVTVTVYGDCASNHFCLFIDRDGSGGIIFQVTSGWGTCVNLQTSANDRATSYANRLIGRHAEVYRDANCTGHALHKDNGFGGPTQPFPSTGTNSIGNFINVNNPVVPGCSAPDHCDNDIATSVWFNNG